MNLCEDTYFPFKIENLSIRNAPCSKEYYWNYLDIDKNNKILRKMKRTSKFELVFNVPQMPLKYPPLTLAVHFRNLRNYDVPFAMKRVKLCDCHYITKQITINRFLKTYDCVHRELLQILPFDGIVAAHELVTLIIEFRYDLLGVTNLLYKFNTIGFELNWQFNFDIKMFDASIMILSKSLLPIQLSDAYPPHQPVWIYNPFPVDLNLYMESNCDILEVFTLITREMSIKPNEYKPMLVEFNPLQVKRYSLEVLFKWLNLENCNCGLFTFAIEGDCKSKLRKLPNLCPSNGVSCLITPLIPIPNHLDIQLKQTGSITRIVKLQNNSRDCAQYSWKPAELDSYYRIEVNPLTGTIKSMKTKKIEITIVSMGTACWFNDILLKCDISKYDRKANPDRNYAQF